MGEAHTIVQRVERRRSLLFIIIGAASRLPAIGVLQIGFRAVGLQFVLCLQRIDHVEVLSCMGNAIACRVAHLVFDGVLLHVFMLQRDGSFYFVAASLVLHQQLHALHGCIQIVAGMFEVGSHAEVLGLVGLRQPVLALNVEAFLFLCGIGRREQRQTSVGREVTRDG